MKLEGLLQKSDEALKKHVEKLEADYYAQSSIPCRDSAWKKWLMISERKKWSPENGWDTPEKVSFTAAALRAVVPQSAVTSLSQIKSLVPPLSDLVKREYSRSYRACERSMRPAEQDLPLTVSVFKRLDRHCESRVDRITLRGLILALFLLCRSDEIKDLRREPVGDDKMRFVIPKSKTDRKGKGCRAFFRCSCDCLQSDVPLTQAKLCPVHVLNEQDWKECKSVSAQTWRNRFYVLLRKAGIPNTEEGRKKRLFSLHSSRVGGSQCCIQSLGLGN